VPAVSSPYFENMSGRKYGSDTQRDSAVTSTSLAEKRHAVAANAARFAFVGARKAAFGVLGVAGAVGLWWLISLGTISARVPSPPEVIETVWENFLSIKVLEYTLMTEGGIYQNLLYTFENVILGVSIGTIFGFAIGMSIGRIRIVRDVLAAPLLFLGTIPIVMILPFLSMWFGMARIAQNGLVIFYSALTVSLVTQQATLNVAERYEQYARSLGVGSGGFILRIVLPAIIPDVLGAIRVSLAAGWGLETVAEILGAPNGAGRLIMVFSWSVMTPQLIGVLVCLGVLAVLIDAIVALVGRWVVRWQE
jgi:ABC-type nitrate/sulfonate/bicarbonate transport system permease component